MVKVYVFDLESNGLLDEATRVHCGVVSPLGSDTYFEYRPHQIDELLEKLNEADVLIGHNIIGFDIPLLRKLYGFEYKGKLVDSLIMSRLHNPDRKPPFGAKNPKEAAKPHGLYAWGVRVGVDKPEYEAWEEFDEDMLHRCREDVRINVLTFQALMDEIKGQNWRNAHLLTFELFKNLHEQEQYGWLMDRKYMEKSISLLTHWIERIDKALVSYLPMKVVVEEQKVKGEYNYVKKPFKKDRSYNANILGWMERVGLNPDSRPIAGPFTRVDFRLVDLNSNDETKTFLLQEGWEPETWNYKKDKKGKPEKDENGNLIKTSPKLHGEDPFLGVNGKVGRLIAKRVQCRHRRSQIEGWMKLIRDDGRISARVSGVATTGRMKHAGVVNVPGDGAFFGKQMRKCFICKKGYVIVGTDAASCQDRCLAARANSPEFTKMLLEGDKDKGTDGHSLARDAINAVLRKHGLKEITRRVAKNFNYGWKFGASDRKLGLMANTNADVGAEIRQALFNTFPAQAELIDRLTKEWRSHAKKRMNQWNKIEYVDGWITGLDGRPIYIPSEHQILVYCLQSDEAILMSAAYNLIFKRAKKKGWKYGEDWGMLAWQHDEVQIEVKEEFAEEMAELSERCIEDASRFYQMAVEQKGESDIGRNWLETH